MLVKIVIERYCHRCYQIQVWIQFRGLFEEVFCLFVLGECSSFFEIILWQLGRWYASPSSVSTIIIHCLRVLFTSIYFNLSMPLYLKWSVLLLSQKVWNIVPDVFWTSYFQKRSLIIPIVALYMCFSLCLLSQLF